MGRICVFLGAGFEEIEALTVVDLLRRDKLDVVMVSIDNKDTVTGSHGITVAADIKYVDVDFNAVEMLVLPGGSPGTENLEKHKELTEQIREFNLAHKKIAAICAAPRILGKMGILMGKRAVCFPGNEEYLQGASLSEDEVVTDGHITTSRGMGTSIPFALELIKLLDCKEAAEAFKHKIVYRH